MINYVKGYALLAGYVALTEVAGWNYWQVEPASRPWWMVGALAVLVLAPRRRRVT
jgi:MYXO-CTERM domain-containing protein